MERDCLRTKAEKFQVQRWTETVTLSLSEVLDSAVTEASHIPRFFFSYGSYKVPSLLEPVSLGVLSLAIKNVPINMTFWTPESIYLMNSSILPGLCL